jgi:hypothetical protein
MIVISAIVAAVLAAACGIMDIFSTAIISATTYHNYYCSSYGF